MVAVRFTVHIRSLTPFSYIIIHHLSPPSNISSLHIATRTHPQLHTRTVQLYTQTAQQIITTTSAQMKNPVGIRGIHVKRSDTPYSNSKINSKIWDTVLVTYTILYFANALDLAVDLDLLLYLCMAAIPIYTITLWKPLRKQKRKLVALFSTIRGPEYTWLWQRLRSASRSGIYSSISYRLAVVLVSLQGSSNEPTTVIASWPWYSGFVFGYPWLDYTLSLASEMTDDWLSPLTAIALHWVIWVWLPAVNKCNQCLASIGQWYTATRDRFKLAVANKWNQCHAFIGQRYIDTRGRWVTWVWQPVTNKWNQCITFIVQWYTATRDWFKLAATAAWRDRQWYGVCLGGVATVCIIFALLWKVQSGLITRICGVAMVSMALIICALIWKGDLEINVTGGRLKVKFDRTVPLGGRTNLDLDWHLPDLVCKAGAQ